VKLTKELAIKVINGLLYEGYEVDAEEPAEGDEDLQDWVDALGELNEKHGPDMVIALADFAEDHLSEHVNVHEVDDFAQRTFKGSGHEKGAILKEYAEHDEFDLGKLWNMLDKSGGMDSFNWNDYAESGSSWVNHLYFIDAAATGTADTIYLFEED
jgi:hypothetical protein